MEKGKPFTDVIPRVHFGPKKMREADVNREQKDLHLDFLNKLP